MGNGELEDKNISGLCARCEALPDRISSYTFMCDYCKLKMDSEVAMSVNMVELFKKNGGHSNK